MNSHFIGLHQLVQKLKGINSIISILQDKSNIKYIESKCREMSELRSFHCSCFYLQVATEHSSVEESRRLQTEPIDLYECLKAFTKEEELGEEELWYCNKCKKHRLAVKKLDLWRLPPILVSQ